ncbi:hypothetical protein SAMN05216229_10111 [Geopseudomonas sagittaria]|uniref:Uncharacterized protein n=1 Tax=Geopseudomonas sagittaria TaxID=1135990 RepID=A0A1I5NHD2_9GAMM|nr:HEPN domain-containing protein [Pseudomonas sagittaria]SFP21189.1 hypothetical protein SAMN05216229_10111 [Pseudomonas sagittaria]
MPAEKWTLRLSVKLLGEKSVSGLESEPTFQVGTLQITAKERTGHLVLQARDFDSEAAAVAYVPHLKAGLWNLSIERNIAFVPYFQRREIIRANDPEGAAKHLDKGFNLPYTGPVHGLTEEAGFTVYRGGENIRFFSMSATGYVSTPWAMVEESLSEGIQLGNVVSDQTDPRLDIALDLYLAHLSESSTRARFLTLMMALEVLAPEADKHAEAVVLLQKFAAMVQAKLNATSDDEAYDALQALLREIDFRKETSIRRRVRKLVLDVAPLSEPELNKLARKVVNAYDLRGSLVHTGTVDAQALSDAYAVVLNAIKLILQVRLGIKPTDRAS